MMIAKTWLLVPYTKAFICNRKLSPERNNKSQLSIPKKDLL